MKYFTGITDSLESPPGMENRDKKNHLQAIIVNMSKFKWFLSVSYSHQLIVTIDLDAVHTRPEKFTRKTLQKFSKKFENTTNTGHFGFAFEENSSREMK